MEIYHVLNRGVEKRNVFLDDYDRLRFVQNLYLLNNKRQVLSTTRKTSGVRYKDGMVDLKRDPLVRIHAFCLMPNHYHILLSPIDDDQKNISLFMQKINMAYAKYFNEKYDRSGYLWQGVFKKIHISRDAHFMYIPYYIHLNPLDLKYPEWRNGGVKNFREAIQYLNNYRWSSYLDYSGGRNFPSILQMNLFNTILGSQKAQEKEIKNIVTTKELTEDSNLLE